MGQCGGKYSGNATITPDDGYVYVKVQTIAESVLTCVGKPTGISSITFPANTTFYGRYSSITITSGSIIAYQGV